MTIVRTRTVLAALAASTAALTACGTAPTDARVPLQPADTVTTPSSNPSIIYESYGPGPSDWLPLTVEIPSTVEVGEQFTISGTCSPTMIGEFAGNPVYATPVINPPTPAQASGWTGIAMVEVQPDSTFSFPAVAGSVPGTYHFKVSCLAEGWIDDALYSDGNGGTIKRYYEFPEGQMRAVTVVAAAAVTSTTSGSAVTLPPTR